jgi:hypothetical protein
MLGISAEDHVERIAAHDEPWSQYYSYSDSIFAPPRKRHGKNPAGYFWTNNYGFNFLDITTTSGIGNETKGYKIQSGIFRSNDISSVIQRKDANFAQKRLPSF